MFLSDQFLSNFLSIHVNYHPSLQFCQCINYYIGDVPVPMWNCTILSVHLLSVFILLSSSWVHLLRSVLILDYLHCRLWAKESYKIHDQSSLPQWLWPNFLLILSNPCHVLMTLLHDPIPSISCLFSNGYIIFTQMPLKCPSSSWTVASVLPWWSELLPTSRLFTTPLLSLPLLDRARIELLDLALHPTNRCIQLIISQFQGCVCFMTLWSTVPSPWDSCHVPFHNATTVVAHILRLHLFEPSSDTSSLSVQSSNPLALLQN